MSDELANETTPEPTEAPAQAEPQGEAVQETDWKAEARKWEKRAKDANADRDAAQKWREYEESLKPLQEKLADDLNTAKAEAESARTALLRYEIASEKGIPAEAIKLLQGSSREELEEAAETLVSLLANQSKPKSPLPDDSQGRPTTANIGQLSKEDLATMSPAEILEAKKSGRLNDALGIN